MRQLKSPIFAISFENTYNYSLFHFPKCDLTSISYLSPKDPAMRVSYIVAIGMVVLFALLFVLDYVHTSAPADKEADSLRTAVSTPSDSLEPLHKGDIIKQQSTRDIFEALADDDKTDTSQAVIKALRKQDESQ